MTSKEFARDIRQTSLRMVSRANASHIGGALSMADIIAVLYNDILHYDPSDPQLPTRDRFILSKGHVCTALYAALALKGFYPIESLDSYSLDGSQWTCHTSHLVPGVEFSSGSLGHGLPVAVGLALAAKRRGNSHKVYVVVGDGEMDEGSNWEALLFAAQHALDNLCVIIDYNKIQAFGTTDEVLSLEPLADKLRAFRAQVVELDGHDHDALRNAFRTFADSPSGLPTVLVAHTIKGKGVSFMENNLMWHYKAPNAEQLTIAIKETNQ